jgi:homoserine O-acetyltransferase
MEFSDRIKMMDPSVNYNASGIQYYSILSFLFRAGFSLPVRVAYRIFNPSLSRVICVPTSEHSHINSTNNFTSGALKDYSVVVVAMLGNGESSSPSNTVNFPQPLHQDCVNVSHQLFTKHLNIHELEAVVGFGMGGQQAYYWTWMLPGFVKKAVIICGSARTSPFNHMLLDATATALISSLGYSIEKSRRQGTESRRGQHSYGKVTCAWSTSSAWFKEELFRSVLGFETVYEFFDMYDNSSSGWNAADLLALVKMWQLGDIGALRDDKSFTKALDDIEARVLVIASNTDYYFS